MLKRALELWKNKRNKKRTTLHRRLLLFFVMISVSLVLVFALLLSLFGITGNEADAVENHINTELAIIADRLNEDFGRLSVSGIAVAEELSERSDDFFLENNSEADELKENPELLEPLLSVYMQTLITTVNNRYCGGAFVMLDTSVTGVSETAKAGVFIKKTQPTATDAVGVQLHYLRGPAMLARENNIMLLGQWKMEFDITDQEFFTEVMETARDNPDLPLSRLYYWSDRVMLKGNSEAGVLLCIPLRSEDGTVFGLCGIEVSDRLFKSFYTPEGGDFESIFTVMSPICENGLYTSKGLFAGNSYLTGTHWSFDLSDEETHESFHHYSGESGQYGGKTTELKLYPNGSPYEDMKWAASILMPKDTLHTVVKGNASYFIYIVIVLLAASIVASVFISRHYLRPVSKAIDQIKNNAYNDNEDSGVYAEIGDLFVYLSQKNREHDLAMQEKQAQMESLQGEHEKAQTELSRLSYSRKNEVDPDNYQLFLDSLDTLTSTERIVFNHYLDGKTAKEIMAIMGIKEPTLKYHNGNIYQKLGVTSRKELLRYATLMNKERPANKSQGIN